MPSIFPFLGSGEPRGIEPLRWELDQDCLPDPSHFDSLEELDEWADQRIPTCPSRRGVLIDALVEEEEGRERRRGGSSRLLVCHDFQGGYKERSDRRSYSFEHWSLVETLVYFSHHRISPPPQSWIRAAKRHGTKVLGTLIFEWKESIPDLSLLLRGPERSILALQEEPKFSPHFADQLIQLALERDFQGYLINVEVPLDLGPLVSGKAWAEGVKESTRRFEMRRNAHRLRGWLSYLRRRGQQRFEEQGRRKEEWEVIWYDSVTFPKGDLAWQDALTVENQGFFNVSDAVLTNYTWARPPPPPTDPEEEVDMKTTSTGSGLHPALEMSCKVCDSNGRGREEVYVGIDVFGRNCWGGMESWRSLDMIRGHLNPTSLRGGEERWNKNDGDPKVVGGDPGLSVGLFAPGWTWEHEEPRLERKGGGEEGGARSWEDWFREDLGFWIGRRGIEVLDAKGLAPPSCSSHRNGSNKPIRRYFPHHPPPPLPTSSSHGSEEEEEEPFYLTDFALGSGTGWFWRGWRVFDVSCLGSDAEEDDKIVGYTDPGVTCSKPDLLIDLAVGGGEGGVEVGFDQSQAWHGNVSIKVGIQVERWEGRWLPISTVTLPEGDGTMKVESCVRILPDELDLEEVEIQAGFEEEGGDPVSTSIETDEEGGAGGGWILLRSFQTLGGREGGRRVAKFGIQIRTRSEVKREREDVNDSEKRSRFHLGEISIRRVGKEGGERRSKSIQARFQPIGPGREDGDGEKLDGILEWPDFSPSSHYYDVLLHLIPPLGAKVGSKRIWLATSTRETRRNQLVIQDLPLQPERLSSLPILNPIPAQREEPPHLTEWGFLLEIRSSNQSRFAVCSI
ncbi:hypothetical protein IE53DRAFT_207724 [Violaceomyces palustris]|uniref:Uncharacterized protein n=1 Tax=Violaceomyces palustris TaxID=1673888 RepID=A0ACD0NR42_9BASI|nr:hypothetical protein IE53DRAFT_207724 [Violaceomyces palustris]